MTRQAKAFWIGFLALFTVVASLLIAVEFLLLQGAGRSAKEAAVAWSLTIVGILLVVLPWCYWPRHGTRIRAIRYVNKWPKSE